MNELQEENFRHQQAQDAILCRETLILDSGHVGSELANSCAAAMNERISLQNPAPWMNWNSPCRQFCCVSIGSCGLAPGANTVDRMVQLVKQTGFKYTIMKSL
jgi:hypothetical protein